MQPCLLFGLLDGADIQEGVFRQVIPFAFADFIKAADGVGALDVLRHSTAHIMARAILRAFPGTRLAFGPTTGSGFYYDVDVPGHSISESDFPAIEAEMARIVALAEPFERFSLPAAEARQFCEELGQSLKVEHIDDELHKYGVLSFYRQGEFVDLCRGPHIPNAGKVGAFKLLSIAGAYWKGRTESQVLQRVYGTAFFDKKELEAHLAQIEEAKKRDHRRLGKELGLFTISPLVGSGLVLWMPKGAIVRGVLENYIKEELIRYGYMPVYSPHIGKVELYKTSGHYPYYKDSQFPTLRMLSDPAMALVAGLGLLAASLPLAAQPDPLPSWNDGPTKRAILDLVGAVTQEGGPDYVAPGDRVATFDQDGTAWVEQPLYGQALFALDRLAAMAPEHPDWKQQDPFKSALSGDPKAMAAFSEKRKALCEQRMLFNLAECGECTDLQATRRCSDAFG